MATDSKFISDTFIFPLPQNILYFIQNAKHGTYVHGVVKMFVSHFETTEATSQLVPMQMRDMKMSIDHNLTFL